MAGWLVSLCQPVSVCVCLCVCVCVCPVVQSVCRVTYCQASPNPLASLHTTLSRGTTCHPQVQPTPFADQGTKTRPRHGSEANLSLPKSRSFKIKALEDKLAKDLRTSPKQATEAHTEKYSFPLKVRNIKYPSVHSLNSYCGPRPVLLLEDKTVDTFSPCPRGGHIPVGGRGPTELDGAWTAGRGQRLPREL